MQAISEELLGFWGSTREVEAVLGFTTDYATFAVPSASETDSFSKGTFSTWGLRFDVFSTSGLEGAVGRMLSLLALSLKNSLILGCDSATSSEFRVSFVLLFFSVHWHNSYGWFCLKWENFQRPDYSNKQKATNYHFYRWQNTNTANNEIFSGVLTGLGGAPQYSCSPLPRCHLELRVHGDFHKLMDMKSYVG